MVDYREGQLKSQDYGYKKSDCDETFEVRPLHNLAILRLRLTYDELVQGALQILNNLSNSAQLLRPFSELCHSACETMLSRLPKLSS